MAAVRPRRAILLAACALWVSACLSPTLPLPPPSKPTIDGPDSQGNVTLTGSVQPRATVYALNIATNEGRFLVTGADGAYVIVIPAQSGDELSVWYSLGTDDSPSVVFRVP
jgi:hypothetical protein